MSDVKRYAAHCDSRGRLICMEEAEKGNWVEFSSLDALAQRLAAVEGVCVGKPLFRKTNDMVSIEWPDGVDTALVSRPLIDQWVADYNSWHRTWTKERPTEAGWYWWRHEDTCFVVHVEHNPDFDDFVYREGRDTYGLDDLAGGDWCRIPEPREA